MKIYKEYIANLLVNKKVHIKCNCIIGLDVIGLIIDHKIINNEIIYSILNSEGKVIEIGENTPKLMIEIL